MSDLRDLVFVSYSRADRVWKERLLTHLAPLTRERGLRIWDDSLIEPGALWRNEIGEALRRARAAVLLVSPDCLASEYVAQTELPELLKAASAKALKVLWFAIRPSTVEGTEIGSYQPLHDLKQPLEPYGGRESEIDGVLAEIAKKIVRACSTQASVHIADEQPERTDDLEMDPEGARTQRRVLDCVVAPRVWVNERRELRVHIRREGSPGLLRSSAAANPSGSREERIFDFTADDVRSCPFDVAFPAQSRRLEPVELQIEVDAPDFSVDGRFPYAVKLLPKSDSHQDVFHATANVPGRLWIIVRILESGASLVSDSLATFATPTDQPPPSPRVLAKVQLEVEAIAEERARTSMARA
jgi:hypothetical protein